MKKEQGIKYILLSIIRKDMSSNINVNGTPSGQTSFECRSVKGDFNEEPPLPSQDIMWNQLKVKEFLDNLGLTESLNINTLVKSTMFMAATFQQRI